VALGVLNSLHTLEHEKALFSSSRYIYDIYGYTAVGALPLMNGLTHVEDCSDTILLFIVKTGGGGGEGAILNPEIPGNLLSTAV
jgi:hypothetical protein